MNGLARNTVALLAAIIVLVAIGAGVILTQPEQAGVLMPLIGMLVLGLLAVIRGEKGVEVAEKAVATAETVAHRTALVATRIDGQLDELKDLIRTAAFAEGKAAGRSEKGAEVKANGVLAEEREEARKARRGDLTRE